MTEQQTKKYLDKNKLSKGLPCFSCGSKEFKLHPMAYINHIVAEELITCKECGKEVNYWAYGHYENPNTLKELISWKSFSIKYRLKLFLKYLYCNIKKQ